MDEMLCATTAPTFSPQQLLAIRFCYALLAPGQDAAAIISANPKTVADAHRALYYLLPNRSASYDDMMASTWVKTPRPDEPGNDSVWYRGWECGRDDTRDKYGLQPWVAYKGGADDDAPTITAATWTDLLEEIDAGAR